MNILKSKSSNANIFGKTHKQLEKRYLNATKIFGVVKTECIVVDNSYGQESGAVLGYDNDGNIIYGNAYSTYNDNDFIICITARRFDYLIKDACDIVYAIEMLSK